MFSHKSFVSSVFSSVASKYDLMNDVMSFGIHRLWKREFVNKSLQKPEITYLDVACGTGDISALLRKRNPSSAVIAMDPNLDMLQKGREKQANKGVIGIEWRQGSAEQIPLEDNSVDVVTISFGLRNVTDKERSLKEFFRVLKPGGQFLCLEFSKVEHSLLSQLYSMYSNEIIPRLGAIIADDKASYQYLVDSIRSFPSQQNLVSMIECAGFKWVSYKNLSKGIVAIHEGWKNA
jgi:demethylmenaquinone methyltransferase/2-methoxy-6-polyprenyl-1,4-benzoquinol methylase